MTTVAVRARRALHLNTVILASSVLAAACTLAGLATSSGAGGLFALGALLPACAAAVVDARSGRVPNVLVTISLVVIVAVLAFGVASLRSALTGSVVMGGLLLAVHLITPAQLGFGDAKLGFVVGGALGLVDALAVIPVLLLATVVALGLMAIQRRVAVPFAPALVAVAAAAVLVAPEPVWEVWQ
jgi:leader peptidase (prepilin peptidase)/N-methyltransferase